MSHGHGHHDPSSGGPAADLSRIRLYDEPAAGSHDRLRPVRDWVREHVARPHPDLGRKGAVCPFVPLSQRLGLIRYALAEPPVTDEAGLTAAVAALKAHWLAMEPRDGQHAVDKTIVLVLPGAAAETVVRVHDRAKPGFVADGMMLGEFFPGHPGPGLHNPGFRPLHSDIPLLVARSMVTNDLPFLTERRYPPARRAGFVESFLEHQRSASPDTRARAREELTRARTELGRPDPPPPD
ncbi:DUF6875 domain-containing protein [Streptomyces albireticuli]|uniref:DUF6875 domain-containing protein n=1 Tax=Streptomyces albireticuli TaxID=1940 RepID=A0A2A2D590_9ACTN|nr:hypothetical protein [Streptomyces albireticuli]MCD9140722.1 hypothetical protein [Streptomyces albireticuli]MCD9161316.1 hypothetical protein [Streptomyces albireticuli]MCD9190626.1 hypothetical protein [Streptomyces albireticuli]PAU46480.1 hypothetical protein CK936_23930 [Streptomyces albireticuli]